MNTKYQFCAIGQISILRYWTNTKYKFCATGQIPKTKHSVSVYLLFRAVCPKLWHFTRSQFQTGVGEISLHKMENLSECQRDVVVTCFANCFQGYYRCVSTVPVSPDNPWHRRMPPDWQPYMGEKSVGGFYIATADVLRSDRRRYCIATLMSDRIPSLETDESMGESDEDVS